MSEAQNVVNSLQQQRCAIMIKLHALQADAQRHAFGAVVNGSWKARQDSAPRSRLRGSQINACITRMLLYLLKMRGRRCSNYVISTRHRAQPGGCQSGAASRRLPSDVRRSL